MAVYLEENPPARSQFRRTRRAAVTGAVVLHTAENTTDITGPDSGAENVARFIATRTDAAGSYHTVVDADSIVEVGRYEWEMFHEGTGGNRWSLGLSIACEASQWAKYPPRWVDGAIDNAAIAAADMARWVKETRGIDIPAKRITPAEYRAGKPGFISHAELDPGRRSDPGTGFPWEWFLGLYAQKIGAPPPMPERTTEDRIRIIQTSVNATMTMVGHGPLLKVDGDLGDLTVDGIQWVERHAAAQQSAIARQGKELSALEASARQLGSTIKQLGQQVGAHEETISHQTSRITQQNDTISGQNDRILTLEAEAEHAAGVITDLRAQLTDTGGDCPPCEECPELEWEDCPECPDVSFDTELGQLVRRVVALAKTADPEG